MSSSKEIVEIIRKNEISKLELFMQGNYDRSSFKNSNYSAPSLSNSSYIQPLIPEQNLTLLHIAAIYDSLECYILLLTKGGFQTRTISAASYYPLHYACFHSSYEVVMYTLHIDPSIVLSEPDAASHQYMFLSVIGGDPRIVEALFRYNINIQSFKNQRDDIISKCISCRSVECLKILLEHGDQQKEKFGDTSMAMKAVIHNQPEALHLLVHSPNDIKFINSQGESVFSLACFYGIAFKGAILDLLRLMGDNPIEPPDQIHCKGVCHWVCQLADVDVARVMLSMPGVRINRLDEKGTPGIFQLIDKHNDKEGTEKLIELIRIMIEHGFNLNIRAPKQNGVFKTESVLEKFVSSIRPNIKIIQFLIANGADIYAPKKNNNRRLVDVAITSKNKELKLLFENKLSEDQILNSKK